MAKVDYCDPSGSHALMRDLYADEVDYRQLAQDDPEFAKVCHDGKVDYKDPQALQQLTKSLLMRDFSIDLILPDDRLCPPVPIRYAYIRLLHSLLATTHPSYHPPTSRYAAKLLDIGTGASAIYALLATATHSLWRVHGTELDTTSRHWAGRNVGRNDRLSKRIKLHQLGCEDPIVPRECLPLDVCLCNPPFYPSLEAMRAATEAKATPPSAVCTGGWAEMICHGGDEGFALRIVAESVELKTQVGWYTVMFGRKSSVAAVVERIKEHTGNWFVSTLRGGQKTRRWVVGWSYGDMRPGAEVGCEREWGGPILEREIKVEGSNRAALRTMVNDVLDTVDVTWLWQKGEDCGVVEAKANTWSRAARRKKARLDGVDDHDNDQKVAMAVRITTQDGTLSLRWLKGTDEVLFESFCGMLKRALSTK